MKLENVVELKRLPFREKISALNAFMIEEITSGSMMGRVGIAPVGPLQKYSDGVGGNFKDMLMFGSNSYLGFADEPEIKNAVITAIQKYGLGSGGSPAFSGLTFQQKEVEKRLSLLSGHNDAMVVAGGYIANLTWISALVSQDDVVLYDKNSHASTIDALKMANIKHAYSFNTDKIETLKKSLDAAVKSYPNSHKFITIEGVRSIDGSVADVAEMLKIARSYGEKIFFVLDDAHGLGTLGKNGHGTLEYLDLKGKVDLRMSTCSKAMGIQGAFLTGDATVLNYIRTMANPYNYTTAMSQPVLAAINAGIDFMNNHPERLRQLHINKEWLWNGLEEAGFSIYRAPSGIVPIYLPSTVPCEKLNRELFDAGLFANVFYYPLITPGNERIRLSMMATHTPEQLQQALDILIKVGKKYEII